MLPVGAGTRGVPRLEHGRDRAVELLAWVLGKVAPALGAADGDELRGQRLERGLVDVHVLRRSALALGPRERVLE